MTKPLPISNPSLEAEGALLAALQTGTDPVVVQGIITEDDFESQVHRTIYRALLGIAEVGDSCDTFRLRKELSFMGAQDCIYRVAELGSVLAFPEEVESYARVVRSYSTRRRLIQALETAASLAMREDTGRVIAGLESELSALEDKEQQDLKPIGFYSSEFESRVTDIEQGNPGILGLPTGFKDLDRVTGGYMGGELWIIAARPGMGKTAFAMESLFQVASTEGPGLFISLEMSGGAIFNRLACSLAKVDLLRLRSGFLKGQEIQELRGVSSVVKAVPLYLMDAGVSGTDLWALKAIIKKAKRKLGIRMVVIDYLQLISIRGHRGNRENEVATISRELKQLSRRLDIPVVALSQLSRSCESRENKRPMLSDLRESGAIEQDADTVLFLFRDEYYNKASQKKGTCEAILAKQRNGPPITVDLSFVSAYAKFGTLDERPGDSVLEQPEFEERTW